MSCVALTNVVVSGVPAKLTCAPLTKLLPVTARVKLPAFADEGEILLRMGVAFSKETAALFSAAELAVLVAVTVAFAGFGSGLGAT